MNPKQAGDIVRSLLLASGVSATAVGYFTAEQWTAIGGLVVALGSAAWQYWAWRTTQLIAAALKADPKTIIAAVAENPEVTPKLIAAVAGKSKGAH